MNASQEKSTLRGYFIGVPTLAVLCEVVGRFGGTERYWETVMPALAQTYDVRLFARTVLEPDRFGVRAVCIPWSDENGAPSPEQAAVVARSVADCDAVITASVFDPLVLAAARCRPRWIARVHDYRAFCPNGNKVFPQFASVCTSPMGGACVVNAFARGCVNGAHARSLRRIHSRMRVRDELLNADRVVVSSRYMAAVCRQNGIRGAALAITPPPLPDEAFADPVKAPSTNAVLFFGRMNDKKGLPSLIRALGRIAPDRRPPLVVAGAGDAAEESAARDLVNRHGINATWRGWLPADELREAIDAASIVAVPSLWPEPFGLTGTEALARGRPVVAYRVGGVPEWIEGAGIAVARGDEGALAAEIVRLSGDPSLWNAVSTAARTKGEQYRLGRHVAILKDLLEQKHSEVMAS